MKDFHISLFDDDIHEMTMLSIIKQDDPGATGKQPLTFTDGRRGRVVYHN